MVLMISPIIALIEDQVDDLLILLPIYHVFDNVLVLYNAKKNQDYCTNF